MSRGSKEEIFGERIFRGVSTFFGDVVFKKHMTLYAPNPNEPSLGTPHPTSDANRTATLVVNTSTNTAGTWSAAVTMTGVPAGAKAAWCKCSISNGASSCDLSVEAASGFTLSDTTAGTNLNKYFGVHSDGSGITALAFLKIHLDANGQFKWCTTVNNSTVKIGSAIEYEE